MHLTGTMNVNNKGHLEIGGVDAVYLAEEFGTPLWVLDEQGFRQNCRNFKNAFSEYGDSLVIYASKSLCTLSVCRMVDEEDLGLDIVSGGELFTSLKAGFPAEKIYFHGNNKSSDELKMALEAGVGRIVVDNFYELRLLDRICSECNKVQDILLRITPGVEAHTHEYIKTGQVDSKFGFSLLKGQAIEGIKDAITSKNLSLVGLHCHIGSQIFEMDSFRYAAAVMMDFVGEAKKITGYEFDELNLGGGFGIYYYYGDEPREPREWAEAVMLTVQEKSRELGLRVPKVIVEPGRAISGPAGITLYTIGSIKEIPGIRKYIAVDGGMTDNPRPALYGAKYKAMIANKADRSPQETVSVAGKCCESGDMLIWDAYLPQVETGDILAVFATGAYNYSMASNYNRLLKPAMVVVNEGKADIIVRRENYEDLIRNDIILDRLKK